MMRDRLYLGVYAAAVVAATSIHGLRFLWLLGLFVYLAAWRSAGRVAWKAIRAILIFNSVVSAAYATAALVRGDFRADYLALLNSRVFVMTSMTFVLADRANLLRAISFSKPLTHLATLAISQIRILRRTQQEIRLALRSRTIGRLGLRVLYRHAGASGSYFLDRALRDSTEITMGMKSRGFFDD